MEIEVNRIHCEDEGMGPYGGRCTAIVRGPSCTTISSRGYRVSISAWRGMSRDQVLPLHDLAGVSNGAYIRALVLTYPDKND